MAKDGYFKGLVGGIRHGTYGRDIRAHVANACMLIDQKEQETNVVEIDVSPIAEHEGYYTLELTLKHR